MIDPSPNPSRQLRIFAHFARWSLGLLLAFWLLLFAVWGTLHGFIVPRIGEWREDVTGLASQALGVPVRMDAISARSEGLFPTFHLSGLTILDAQGRDALKLERVIATVSARSVLRLGLEQLYIEAPQLDIRHLADGRWQVAGIDIVHSDSTESPALEWLLEQPELVIQKGTVHFVDEQRKQASAQLRDVNLVLRNRHWNHVIRLEAKTDAADSDSLQVVGAFRQPLLPSSKAPWTRWSGQWYAELNLHKVPALPWPQAWGVKTIEGSGATRAWLDIEKGRPIGIAADLALPTALVEWQNPDIQNLAVHDLQGRVTASWQTDAWRLQGKNFRFRQADGGAWASSNWEVSATGPYSTPNSTNVALDYADLRMASAVAQALPLPPALQQAITRWSPEGQLRAIKLHWRANGNYQASGLVEQLKLPPHPSEPEMGTPGVEGLNARFELNAHGGSAELAMQSGVLHFPGVFEEAAIALDQLQAQVRWSVDAGRIKVEVPQAQFANADAEGQLQASWRMGETPADRLPGYLQLQGTLTRADGARVHRYLPLEIPAVARHYVRDSVRQGQASNVEFEVKGNLTDMPFDRPGSGRFFVKAPVKNVIYDFVPPALQAATAQDWPGLIDLSGTLVFEGSSMKVQQADTGFVGHPKVRFGAVAAQIADLSEPHLTVNASGHADLQAVLGLVKSSALAKMTSHALDEARAQGDASVAFDLALPIDHLDQTKVRGRIGFQNNALQIQADTPWLQQIQGAVQFDEQGFKLLNVRGRALGGSLQIGGGMASSQSGVHIQAQGIATAQGLRNDASIALVTKIAAHAQGQAAYTVDIQAQQAAQHVAVRSDLRGMALDLPAPLYKHKDEAVALEVLHSETAPNIQVLHVKVQDRGQAYYQRDLSFTPAKVVRGHIFLGAGSNDEHISAASNLVTARIALPALDVDAWVQTVQGDQPGQPAAIAPEAQAYLPQRLEVDVGRLLLQQRELDAVTAKVTQEQGVWRGQLNARQFAGNVTYHPPSAGDVSGRLFARLSHLSIPKSEAQRLNQVTDAPSDTDPHTLPALDIEVERLEIAGRALGKLQLQARNSKGPFGRDWLLEQFYLTTSEARWKANGYWGATARGAPKTTHLSFLLEMDSAGKLLERFDMPGVIRDGQGRLSGNLSWQGSPITPHWSSMDGGIHMQVDRGQFLKVEPGMGKLLSVLSLQSLTRRVSLDFRDLFSQGFAFDFIRGDIKITQGIAQTNNLQMKGLNAAVLMEGKASLKEETQDLKVVVVPEINAMTASLVATAINPVVGLGSFLAQMFLRGPLMEAATRTFHVHGPWSDPVVDAVTRKREEALPGPPQGVQP